MRIALVLPYDLARPGGVRTHTLALATWLRRAGHDAHVIAPSSDPAAANGLWLHDVGRPFAVRIGGTVGSLTLSPSLVRSVRNLLDADWDIVHIQEPLVPSIGPAALVRALGRVPTVLTFHSAEAVAGRLYGALGSAIRPHIRRADARIAVSTAALAIAAPVLGGPAALIPPCIDYGGAAGPRRGAETGAPVVLFVGRDEPRKGLPVLLRAMARIVDGKADRDAHRGPVLHVAGAVRPETTRLIERLGLAERVRLHGAVGTAEVRRLLGTRRCCALRRWAARPWAWCWSRRWPRACQSSPPISMAIGSPRAPAGPRCSRRPAMSPRWRPRSNGSEATTPHAYAWSPPAAHRRAASMSQSWGRSTSNSTSGWSALFSADRV